MALHLHIPNLEGASADSRHDGWLDIDELSWGVSRKIVSPSSTRKDRESANAELSDIAFVRYMDRATPSLFLSSCCGSGQTVTVRLTSTGSGAGSSEYMEYILENAMISGYKMFAVKQSKRRPLERIVISATRVELRYTPHDDEGRPMAPLRKSFDFEVNEKG